MKKKIAILGSTGSIGKSTINIIEKNINDFEVVFLSTNKNLNIITRQYKKLRPKFLIIKNHNSYLKFIKKNKHKNIKVFNNYDFLKDKIITKLDYVINAISGFEGLEPTLKIIPFTKKIGIANKESLICAWNLIKYQIDKYKTKFIPIDSEHFSIWSLINNNNSNIEKIFITASGGPFLKKKMHQLKKIKPSQAIKHPRWSMGKKISVDSATLINKVFEIIEAKKIFNLNLKKFEILTHPDSYVHAIVKFRNGLTKILIHDTDMKIPIFNSIYENKIYKTSSLDISKLNNFKFKRVNSKQFPAIKLINNFNEVNNSLYETVIVSANDELVDLFLKQKIKFLEISEKLIMIMNLKEFKKMRYIKPKNYQQISSLNKYVRLKTRALCVRSARYV